MIILLVLLLIASLWGMKISSFHKDYMSLDATSAIKGIFAVLILFSHMRQYMDLSDTFFNNSYIRILNYLGQMMVTMYLFYSGYGLMESFKKKPDYKKNFLHNRVLKILIHFDVLYHTSISFRKTVPYFRISWKPNRMEHRRKQFLVYF